jgi:hypothetical protein
MSVLRWTNIVCGFLFVLAAGGFLLFLSDNIHDYSREPEDVWLGLGWIAVLGFLALLCFVNAWALRRMQRLR